MKNFFKEHYEGLIILLGTFIITAIVFIHCNYKYKQYLLNDQEKNSYINLAKEIYFNGLSKMDIPNNITIKIESSNEIIIISSNSKKASLKFNLETNENTLIINYTKKDIFTSCFFTFCISLLFTSIFVRFILNWFLEKIKEKL